MQTKRLNRRALLGTAAAAPWVAGAAFGSRKRAGHNGPSSAPPSMPRGKQGWPLLKPSAVELERGLKLHAESLVFDCYGFSPRCAVDGERMAKAIAAGASDVELQDLQEDMGDDSLRRQPPERAEFELGWQAAGVTCIFQNAGEEGQDPLRLLKRLGRFTLLDRPSAGLPV